MGIRVQIPAPLRALTGGAAEVEVEAADVAGLIEGLESRHKGLKSRLCDASGNLRSYVRIFVNEEDIRFLQEKGTPLKPGDTVAIVPAIAGGSAGRGSAGGVSMAEHAPLGRQEMLRSKHRAQHAERLAKRQRRCLFPQAAQAGRDVLQILFKSRSSLDGGVQIPGVSPPLPALSKPAREPESPE